MKQKWNKILFFLQKNNNLVALNFTKVGVRHLLICIYIYIYIYIYTSPGHMTTFVKFKATRLLFFCVRRKEFILYIYICVCVKLILVLKCIYKYNNYKLCIIGLHHSPDGITNPKCKLLCFITTKFLLQREERTSFQPG